MPRGQRVASSVLSRCRGAGWTLACGSGACAAVAVLQQRDDVDASVQVDLPGGTLQIARSDTDQSLWMTGPAAFAFEGDWPVPARTG